jgi:hypothetical protein
MSHLEIKDALAFALEQVLLFGSRGPLPPCKAVLNPENLGLLCRFHLDQVDHLPPSDGIEICLVVAVPNGKNAGFVSVVCLFPP